MNEHQLRQKQQQEASRKFLNALSAGQVGAVDRFQNRVEPGAKVLYHLPFDLVYDVVNVSPVLDPRAPVGLVDVVLMVTFPVRMQANAPHVQMVVMSGAEKPAASENEARQEPEEPAGAPALSIVRLDDEPETPSDPAGLLVGPDDRPLEPVV